LEPERLPAYSELPVKPGAPPGSAWGLFGGDDQLGTLNLLTPERTAAAARLVRKGRVFPLNLRIDRPDPPLYFRGAVKHTILARNPNSRDDYLDSFYPQASSQWDSLRHIRNPEHGFYNGTRDDEIGPGETGKLGIEQMARRGIAGRGVLLDIARFAEAEGRPIDPATRVVIDRDMLQGCARAQDVGLQTGDILIVRTGWLRWYLEETTPEERQRMAAGPAANLRAPGLGPAEEMTAYLWDLHVAAVAADNPALEAWPPISDAEFMHRRLIPLLGMPIGELWYLEDLAAGCAADGCYDFFFTSAPLNVPGGVGSPPNALAVL
jgi:kynurenine formamidase